MPPVYSTIGLTRQQDYQIGISVIPPTNIAGWSLSYQVMYRLGGSGILIASAASGFNNTSGINITNAAAGQFSVTIPGIFTSGLVPDVYWGQACRTDSGSFSVLSEVIVNLLP